MRADAAKWAMLRALRERVNESNRAHSGAKPQRTHPQPSLESRSGGARQAVPVPPKRGRTHTLSPSLYSSPRTVTRGQVGAVTVTQDTPTTNAAALGGWLPDAPKDSAYDCGGARMWVRRAGQTRMTGLSPPTGYGSRGRGALSRLTISPPGKMVTVIGQLALRQVWEFDHFLPFLDLTYTAPRTAAFPWNAAGDQYGDALVAGADDRGDCAGGAWCGMMRERLLGDIFRPCADPRRGAGQHPRSL